MEMMTSSKDNGIVKEVVGEMGQEPAVTGSPVVSFLLTTSLPIPTYAYKQRDLHSYATAAGLEEDTRKL